MPRYQLTVDVIRIAPGLRTFFNRFTLLFFIARVLRSSSYLQVRLAGYLIVVFRSNGAQDIVVSNDNLHATILYGTLYRIRAGTVSTVFLRRRLRIPFRGYACREQIVVRVVGSAMKVEFFRVGPEIVNYHAIVFNVPVRANGEVQAANVIMGGVGGGDRAHFITFVSGDLVRVVNAMDLIRDGVRAEVMSPTIVTVRLLRQRRLGDVRAWAFRVSCLLRDAIRVTYNDRVARRRFVSRRVVFVKCPRIFGLPFVEVPLCFRCENGTSDALKVLFHVKMNEEKGMFVIVQVRCLATVDVDRAGGLPNPYASVVLGDVFANELGSNRYGPPTTRDVVPIRLTITFVARLPIVGVARSVNGVLVSPFLIFVVRRRHSYKYICRVSSFLRATEREDVSSDHKFGKFVRVVNGESGQISIHSFLTPINATGRSARLPGQYFIQAGPLASQEYRHGAPSVVYRPSRFAFVRVDVPLHERVRPNPF